MIRNSHIIEHGQDLLEDEAVLRHVQLVVDGLAIQSVALVEIVEQLIVDRNIAVGDIGLHNHPDDRLAVDMLRQAFAGDDPARRVIQIDGDGGLRLGVSRQAAQIGRIDDVAVVVNDLLCVTDLQLEIVGLKALRDAVGPDLEELQVHGRMVHIGEGYRGAVVAVLRVREVRAHGGNAILGHVEGDSAHGVVIHHVNRSVGRDYLAHGERIRAEVGELEAERELIDECIGVLIGARHVDGHGVEAVAARGELGRVARQLHGLALRDGDRLDGEGEGLGILRERVRHVAVAHHQQFLLDREIRLDERVGDGLAVRGVVQTVRIGGNVARQALFLHDVGDLAAVGVRLGQVIPRVGARLAVIRRGDALDSRIGDAALAVGRAGIERQIAADVRCVVKIRLPCLADGDGGQSLIIECDDVLFDLRIRVVAGLGVCDVVAFRARLVGLLHGAIFADLDLHIIDRRVILDAAGDIAVLGGRVARQDLAHLVMIGLAQSVRTVFDDTEADISIIPVCLNPLQLHGIGRISDVRQNKGEGNLAVCHLLSVEELDGIGDKFVGPKGVGILVESGVVAALVGEILREGHVLKDVIRDLIAIGVQSRQVLPVEGPGADAGDAFSLIDRRRRLIAKSNDNMLFGDLIAGNVRRDADQIEDGCRMLDGIVVIGDPLLRDNGFGHQRVGNRTAADCIVLLILIRGGEHGFVVFSAIADKDLAHAVLAAHRQRSEPLDGPCPVSVHVRTGCAGPFDGRLRIELRLGRAIERVDLKRDFAEDRPVVRIAIGPVLGAGDVDGIQRVGDDLAVEREILLNRLRFVALADRDRHVRHGVAVRDFGLLHDIGDFVAVGVGEGQVIPRVGARLAVIHRGDVDRRIGEIVRSVEGTGIERQAAAEVRDGLGLRFPCLVDGDGAQSDVGEPLVVVPVLLALGHFLALVVLRIGVEGGAGHLNLGAHPERNVVIDDVRCSVFRDDLGDLEIEVAANVVIGERDVLETEEAFKAGIRGGCRAAVCALALDRLAGAVHLLELEFSGERIIGIEIFEYEIFEILGEGDAEVEGVDRVFEGDGILLHIAALHVECAGDGHVVRDGVFHLVDRLVIEDGGIARVLIRLLDKEGVGARGGEGDRKDVRELLCHILSGVSQIQRDRFCAVDDGVAVVVRLEQRSRSSVRLKGEAEGLRVLTRAPGLLVRAVIEELGDVEGVGDQLRLLVDVGKLKDILVCFNGDALCFQSGNNFLFGRAEVLLVALVINLGEVEVMCVGRGSISLGCGRLTKDVYLSVSFFVVFEGELKERCISTAGGCCILDFFSQLLARDLRHSKGGTGKIEVITILLVDLEHVVALRDLGGCTLKGGGDFKAVDGILLDNTIEGSFVADVAGHLANGDIGRNIVGKGKLLAVRNGEGETLAILGESKHIGAVGNAGGAVQKIAAGVPDLKAGLDIGNIILVGGEGVRQIKRVAFTVQIQRIAVDRDGVLDLRVVVNNLRSFVKTLVVGLQIVAA